jgi:putative glycosyltransferase (TIGR04348 family)
LKRGTIGLVNPAPQLRGGNRVTALRWSRILRRLGWHTFVEESWSGRPCDVLVALHARRTNSSVVRYHREHPDRPIVVAATGTDVYSDVPDSGEARESFGLATRIVVLQPLAVANLPGEARSRARVVYQSVEVPATVPSRTSDAFEVCVVAHARPVKDPLRTALAARLLPSESRVRVVQVGGVLDEFMRDEFEREMHENPRVQWRGSLSRPATLAAIAQAQLVVSSSRHEGGANAVSEALALGTPVLATAIPGSIGLLGETYPGTFPVGDTEGLAALLWRAETDADFLAALRAACAERASLTEPRRELETWRGLLDELCESRSAASRD